MSLGTHNTEDSFLQLRHTLLRAIRVSPPGWQWSGKLGLWGLFHGESPPGVPGGDRDSLPRTHPLLLCLEATRPRILIGSL